MTSTNLPTGFGIVRRLRSAVCLVWTVQAHSFAFSNVILGSCFQVICKPSEISIDINEIAKKYFVNFVFGFLPSPRDYDVIALPYKENIYILDLEQKTHEYSNQSTAIGWTAQWNLGNHISVIRYFVPRTIRPVSKHIRCVFLTLYFSLPLICKTEIII